MRKIPPLNPAHVFEVVARLGNFTKASKELMVTQSAVSRQIATLEDYLGVRLFHRDNNRVELTHDGMEYYREIGPAFEAISKATDDLLGRYKSNIIHVTCYPTFANKWLIPRLSAFNERHHDVQIKLQTKVAPLLKSSSPRTVSIQLCDPTQVPPDTSQFLFKDRFQPFCSPAFLERHKIEKVEDLLPLKRLGSHYRRHDWQTWMTAMGQEELVENSDDFMSSLLTYKAACEGLGVAMCQNFLVVEEVEQGLLVPLFEPVQRELSHYIIWDKTANHRVRTFVRWITSELSV